MQKKNASDEVEIVFTFYSIFFSLCFYFRQMHTHSKPFVMFYVLNLQSEIKSM